MVEGLALVFVLRHIVVSASVAAPVGRVTVRGCIAIHMLAIVYRAKQKQNKIKTLNRFAKNLSATRTRIEIPASCLD